MSLDTKTGKEVDALDMHALLHHYPRREQRIEPAGYQGNSFALFGHDKIS
jgi:hypothetical protein